MKPSFGDYKSCRAKKILNAKKLGYFKASAGFRVALPSLQPSTSLRQPQTPKRYFLILKSPCEAGLVQQTVQMVASRVSLAPSNLIRYAFILVLVLIHFSKDYVN